MRRLATKNSLKTGVQSIPALFSPGVGGFGGFIPDSARVKFRPSVDIASGVYETSCIGGAEWCESRRGEMPHCGVEVWRGGLGGAYLLPTLSSGGASLAPPCSVSTSRSSNRTGLFQASGSRRRLTQSP